LATRADKEGVSEELQDWLDAISTYEREFKKWEGRVDKILKRYRDETRDNKQSGTDARFNILWSNVQTLVPATFSRLPVPDVTRRFKDNDPTGRVGALLLERALDFEIQHYPDYRATMEQSVLDRFLGGRASAWVRYEPHFKALPGEPDDGVQVTEDVDEPEVQEQLDYECVPVDYVHWKDFGHNVARTWEEVTQVWRKVYMSEDAVTERFGKDMAKRVPFDATPEELKRASREGSVIKKQAVIIELWDKEASCVAWIAKGIKEPLDRVDDPLGLQEFFPCPKPLFATITNDSLIPIPDFALYQDQATTLDILADRISGLVKMLQLKGVYDASFPALQRLFTEGDNGSLLPIKNYAAFAEKGGLAGGIDIVELAPLAQALQTAIEAFQQQKEQIDELTGLADIIRGQSDPRETLGAQKMKGQYSGLRLTKKQQGVAEYATSILRLKAQIMCRKFDPKTLAAMAAVEQLMPEDQQLVPQALALLVGEERMLDPSADSPNPMRSFRIEIAADTLVELDEQQEKQDRMELLTAFGGYLDKAAQVGAMAPQLIPLIIEVGKFGLTAFKVGKTIEGTFDQALDAIKQNAGQPAPDPKVMEEQAMEKAQQAMAIQNAQKEIAINKRSADMDVRKIALDAKESELVLKEKLADAARKMEDEHKAKIAAVEQQAAANQSEHQAAMDQLSQKDGALSLKEKAMTAGNELDKRSAEVEKQATVADEKVKAHTAVADTIKEGHSELKEALAEVAKLQAKTQELISQVADIAAKPRKSRLVRGPDGKPDHAISEVVT
jgi:hypothetical protein